MIIAMVVSTIRFLFYFLVFASLTQVGWVPFAHAQVKAKELRVTQKGDLEMACGALSEEARLMKDIIDTTQDIKDDSTLKSHGINAAGALGSMLIGTATGGISLAAAGFFANQSVEGKSDNADGVQEIAKERRSFMLGVFNSKGCYGPFEYAMQTPEPKTLRDTIASIEPASGIDFSAQERYNR